jgi:hypothetical protein
MKTKYPVGACWEFVAPESAGSLYAGAVGRVWLAERDGRFEMWRWSWRFRDESGHEGDWAPSRRTVVEECAGRFGGRCKVRFRRVESEELVS